MYRIKEIAQLSGVSVRTLHHYDDIGLLRPAEVKENGYRFYDDESLSALQQILFFKELGFSLNDIKRILDDPSFDRKEALESHKKILIEKKERLERIIRSVDQTVNAMKGEERMSNEDMFKPFDMSQIEKHQKQYEEETKEKYGHTDAYKESKKRTDSYKKEDWERIQTEWNRLYHDLASLMNKEAGDAEVQERIADYHKLINDNFYTCPKDMFRGLGEMYVADSRFTKNIDKHGEGLAEFLRDAIRLYCDR
ncbi:MerR family transcriptional regulator [Alteribacter aurantiacus]|uniref:MerR family transcriptional regulator n=1 Tax=Alteribacter aurantiacus TaxID=254410 RepID=UPI00040ABA64|nr:MerR family transcriptional regulator [Alteribacter aurantiacus]